MDSDFGDDAGDVIAHVADFIHRERRFIMAHRQNSILIRRVHAGDDCDHSSRASARLVSIFTMRACGCGECRILPIIIPGSVRSSVYFPCAGSFSGGIDQRDGFPDDGEFAHLAGFTRARFLLRLDRGLMA